MIKLFIILSISLSLSADEAVLVNLNNLNMRSRSEVKAPYSVDINAVIAEAQVNEPKSESAFQKASLPMKAVIIVGIPIVAVGAVVYYIVLTPFALVRWALESKKP